MSEAGKIRVVVRSRKVPTGTVVYNHPIYTMYGVRVGSEPRRVMLYGTAYERHDQKAIDKGKKLARELGLDLEVVDLSNTNPLKRMAVAILGGSSRVTILSAPTEPAKTPRRAEPGQPLFEQSVNTN